MSQKGMTLVEIIVITAIMLLILVVSLSCIIPAYKNFQRSQEESALLSNVQLTVRALNNELKYSDVNGMVIIPATYTHPENGKTYQSYAIAFPSIMAQNGTYSWDNDGNANWTKVGIFYLDTAEGNLYYQENPIAPSIYMKRPAAAFTPRHGSVANRDRLIARNIGSLFLTDSTKKSGITNPAGDFIKVSVTGVGREREFSMEASVYARKTR